MIFTRSFIFILILGIFNVFGQRTSISLTKEWEINLNSEETALIASDNLQEIILQTGNNKIISVNSRGETNWINENNKDFVSNLLIFNNRVFFTSNSENSKNELSITSLSLETGLTSWEIKLETEEPTELSTLSKYNDDIILILNNNSIYQLNNSHGKILSTYKLKNKITSNVIVKKQSLFFATQNNKIIEYSILSNSEKLIFNTQRQIHKIQYLNTEEIIFSDNLGNISLLKLDSGKLQWSFRTGGDINSIINTDQGIIISSFDNYIYFLKKETGRVIWKKRFNGRINGVFLANQNDFAVSLLNGREVLLLDIEKGKVNNQITLNEDSFFTGSPTHTNDLLVFPTNKGIVSYKVNSN